MCNLGHKYKAKVCFIAAARHAGFGELSKWCRYYDTVQPEAANMVPRIEKGIVTGFVSWYYKPQKTLPFGTPADVKKEVLRNRNW